MAESSRIPVKVNGHDRGRDPLSHVALDTPAPDFELPDFEGKVFRLSDLRGAKNVLLVFNRGFT
jgi:hypothetical protein